MRHRCSDTLAAAVWALALVGPLVAADDSFQRYKDGALLDRAGAIELEEKVQNKSRNWRGRATLLGFWTRSPVGDDAEARASRARHLLWLIENRPEASVLEHVQAATFNLKGHRLADPEAYDAGKILWEKHVSAPDASRTTLFHAAVFFSRQDLSRAHDLAMRTLPGDRKHHGLRGEICAAAYIGALGVDHTSDFALWLDSDLPASPLAKECKESAQDGDDRDFLRTFVIKAARDGSDFYLARELSWDYAAFLTEPADRARAADPEAAQLKAIPGLDLPDLNDSNPRVVAIGGGEMQMRLLKSYPPVYPPNERQRGVTGSAHLLVTVSPEGAVLDVNPISGLPGFLTAAGEAVMRWKYEGLVHRGQPYFVLTPVQVNFTLR